METVNVSMDKLRPDDEPSKTFDWIPEEEFNAGSIELTGGESKFVFAGSVAMSK